MAIFLDTNILLYSISSAADEAGKRARALALLERDDCVVSVQVLQEFHVQATRVSRSDPLPHEIAVGLIRTWRRFRVQDNTKGRGVRLTDLWWTRSTLGRKAQCAQGLAPLRRAARAAHERNTEGHFQ